MECWLYEQMEPFGDLRGDLQAGVVAATLVNLKLKPGAEPLSPSKFVPKWEWKPVAVKVQTLEEQLAVWNMVRMAQNATVKKDD